VTPQVQKLRHGKAKVVIAAAHEAACFGQRIRRRPRHRYKHPFTGRESYVFDPNATVFPDGSYTGVGLP
jgi:hypothetical protein